MKNGELWYDTGGNIIHAHGGWILKVDDYYYWYGEDRTEMNFVSCYRTKDFKNFEFRNHVFTANSPVKPSYLRSVNLSLRTEETDDNPNNQLRRRDENGLVIANIERPKVLYCKATGKYVMWMHYENGINYSSACCAVASCDTPDGDFVYHGSFNPFGNESRDCTVYEADGDAFFVSSGRGNRDLFVYRLAEDYRSVEDTIKILFQNQLREAPAFFQKDGQHYVLTSGCTGWRPNQGGAAVTREGRIDGRWSLISDFGDDTTFYSQMSFVLPVEEKGKTEYYYFGDRWGGKGELYFESTYVVLKIKFDENNMPYIEYTEDAQLPFSGK